MIRIGIIGSIGSGKSFIAKLFKFPVFNADNEVGKLYKKSKKIFMTSKTETNYVKTYDFNYFRTGR